MFVCVFPEFVAMMTTKWSGRTETKKSIKCFTYLFLHKNLKNKIHLLVHFCIGNLKMNVCIHQICPYLTGSKNESDACTGLLLLLARFAFFRTSCWLWVFHACGSWQEESGHVRLSHTGERILTRFCLWSVWLAIYRLRVLTPWGLFQVCHLWVKRQLCSGKSICNDHWSMLGTFYCGGISFTFMAFLFYGVCVRCIQAWPSPTVLFSSIDWHSKLHIPIFTLFFFPIKDGKLKASFCVFCVHVTWHLLKACLANAPKPESVHSESVFQAC